VQGRKHGAQTEQQFGQADKPSPCFYLYRSMVVNADGGVSPCCVVYKQNRDFGQLDSSAIDIPALWNNEKFLSARSLFSSQTMDKRMPTVCDACDIFAHHPNKARRSPLAPGGKVIEIHRTDV
jgi:radical SAM protein with 4Fe4S-binding SPASM domain